MTVVKLAYLPSLCFVTSEKDIDPTVGTREITMRGEGRDDFGMTLAGANPVLVMSLLEGKCTNNSQKE